MLTWVSLLTCPAVWPGVMGVVWEFRKRYAPFGEGATQLNPYEEPRYGFRFKERGEGEPRITQSWESFDQDWAVLLVIRARSYNVVPSLQDGYSSRGTRALEGMFCDIHLLVVFTGVTMACEGLVQTAR